MLENIIALIPRNGYFKLRDGKEVEYEVLGKNITFKREKGSDCRLNLGYSLSKTILLELEDAIKLKNTALFRELC